MTLPNAGVNLVAQNNQRFMADMRSAHKSVTSFGDIVDRQSGRINRASEVMIGSFREVGRIGTQVLVDGFQSVIGVIDSTINTAADFEKTLSGVDAVLSPTASEMEALRQKALDLGQATAFSASESALALEMLAKNGLSATEIINGAADATVNLAAATGADLPTAADIATDSMAIFGLTADQMTDAINGISAVVVSSKFDINDYALALAQGGGVAGAVGVEFDQFNASIAAISPLFASGSDAGTSYKTMLQRLVPASDPAAAAMRELGIITADGTNRFFDANGQLKDMTDISRILAVATANLSEEKKNEALQTIFGTDAMRAAVGMAESGEVAYADMNKAIAETGLTQEQLNKAFEDGVATHFEILEAQMGLVDASDQASKRLDNFHGATEQVMGSLDSLKIVIGSALLPVLAELFNDYLTPGINEVTKFAQSILDAEKPMQTLNASVNSVVPGFSTFIDWVRQGWQALQPLVTIIQDNLEPILISLAAVLTGTVIAAVSSAIATFIAAAAPIAALVAASAVLIAAWQNDFGGIRTLLTNLWTNTLQPLFTAWWQWINQTLPQATAFLADVYNLTLKPALDRTIQVINDVLLPVLNALWTFVQNDLAPLFTALAEVYIAGASLAFEALAGMWQNVLRPALVALQIFLDRTLAPIFDDFVDWLSTATGGLEGISKAIQSVIGWLKDMADRLKSLDLPDWLTPGSPTPWEIGLWGIAEAMQEVSTKAIPELRRQLHMLDQDTDFAKNLNDMIRDLENAATRGTATVARTQISNIERLEDLTDGANQSLDDLMDAYRHIDTETLRGRPVFDAVQKQQQFAVIAGRRALEAQTEEERKLYERAAERAVEQANDEIRRRNELTAEQIQQQLSDAEREAAELAKTDAQMGAEFFDLRSSQIFELAELERELNAAATQDQRASINRRIELTKQAQRAEVQLLQEQARQRAEELAKLAEQAQEMKNEGDNIAAGIARGILDNIWRIEQAMTEAMQRAIEAGRTAIDAQSPAKVPAMRIGLPFVQGIEQMFARGQDMLAQSASQMMVAPVASAAQIAGSMAGGNVTTTNTRYYQYAPTYSSTPRQPQQDFALMEVLSA